MGHITISLPDPAATRALGARIAQLSPPGTVILLSGPLGAGKTTLVEGAAQALHAGRTASPTFVIAHSYTGAAMRISHLDLYRIEDPRDIEDLDLSAYIAADGITLVEWAERAAAERWPEDRIEVDLRLTGEAREARVTTFGALETAIALADIRALSDPLV
ncbi:MAG: tRNA (adenosine(37)-N6)-threonylcarbamoyltransferase complex ATPase subunit type 1 TsaE [Candidatus Eremiobacteraeota bacterium]|nr:tRNA (adenosine(37)-N6)-threonylcarbamoyltransferase complex ATPase subunit type 1 TsaE [Candidatus Eremiobacteraeota bacterium]